MSNMQGSFVDSVIASARDNPIAAALIGGGAVWLLMGNDKLKSAATFAAASAFPSNADARKRGFAGSGYQATPAPPTAPEMDNDNSFGVGDRLRHAGDTVSKAASEATDVLRDRFDESASYASETLGKLGKMLPEQEKISSSLSGLLERQPLVLGAVGLAIGAAVAGAFKTFDLENKWVGGYSDSVKQELNERAGAVAQSVREAADTLQNEIKDAGAETFDKVKQAGLDAAQAASHRAEAP